MNKKILFIQPTIYDDAGNVVKKNRLYFIGLAFPLLAAMTPPDWSVEICLETIEDIPFETDAEVIGIGGMGQAANRGKDIAIEFKKRGKTVLMGGPMVSLVPELVKPFCDSIIIGDAELVWPRVLSDLEAGTLQDFYKEQVTELITPLPRYELVMGKKIGDFLPVQAARGCPHTCSFCSIYCIYRGRYLKRKVGDVIRDIRQVKALGFKKLLLLDDNINADRAYMLELCREIKKLDMKWMSQCVIDIARDPELIDAVAQSGCYLLSFGLESISPESLVDLNKSWADPREYEALITIITDAGIDVATEMIVGVDGDTPDSLMRTIEFVKRSRIIAPKFYIMTPIPGTDFYNKMIDEGRMVAKDVFSITASRAAITHPRFTPDELNAQFWKIYRSLYSWRRILKRTVFHKRFFSDPGRYLFFLLVNLAYKLQIRQKIAPIIM